MPYGQFQKYFKMAIAFLMIKVGDDPDTPFGRCGISLRSTYSASAYFVKIKRVQLLAEPLI
jgi:hypothetical protein